MLRSFWVSLLLLLLASPAAAVVELALGNQAPVTINEVYMRDGVAFLPVDEVLAALQLSGKWDSVDHVYTIKTPFGNARISPGSNYLRLTERFIPLEHPPRFIDGRLRISEDFLTVHFPNLLTQSVYYRNLNPQTETLVEEQTPLDQLFALLLRKKGAGTAAPLRAVAIDPGHGGQETGALGIGAVKEKDIALGVAKRLEKLLKMNMGIPVYLSRDGDYSLSTQQRLEAAAKTDVDALIQLHAQAALSGQPQGINLVIRPQEEFAGQTVPGAQGDSMRLARRLRDAFNGQGLEVAGIYQAPLLPLGRGNLPTVLVEMGYLTNAADQALLSSPEGQERLAAALFQGVRNFAEELKETAQ
ncbi:hypothetical protein DESUT3_26550 [Desulfuromonas versatilis]|uniref:N-acetylmuramoyl-L-alanine amidase n=1 Tax=Desulfuromonas versatilis TaxID=2802975 RepID=A0ABM8HXY6_9BACT|nr:N-acetylmuramoyl-L-alanine amidase [Desulfuromonas versatilis]BCR05586.1 hypothetical protein DESUT3_26550 [Desulfuromonas versatilis]